METRPSFIHDDMTLKLLVLYLLRKAAVPVPETELLDTILRIDEGIDYFTFTGCLQELLDTEHILSLSAGYALTEKGAANGQAMESFIPASVRLRTEAAATALARELRRRSLIEAGHELRARGGFTVNLSLSDELGPLLRLELLCGDEKSLKRIEENFRANAETIYTKIAELLLG